MELQTAIEILEYPSRMGDLREREDMIHEPKKLTEALDIVLSEVKKFRLGAVVGRSEQLVCDHQWKSRFSEKRGSWRLCTKCSKEG